MDLLSFSGRANRMDFWMVSIGLTFLQLIVTLLAGLMIGNLALSWLPPDQKTVAAGWFALIVQLLFVWPITAVAVRRSHDRNLSGWWYGAYTLFGLGLTIAGLVVDRLAIPEEASAGLIFSALDMAHIAAMLVFFILLGFLPGTQGTNRFGPAPNSRQENYRAPIVD